LLGESRVDEGSEEKSGRDKSWHHELANLHEVS
jgi:hypothetical protein